MVARSVNPGGVSRLVALKRILPRLASDQFIVDQFLDEAKLGMRFDHQNLVTAMTSEMPRLVLHRHGAHQASTWTHLIYWQHGPLKPSLVSAILCQRWKGCMRRMSSRPRTAARASCTATCPHTM